MRILIKSGDLVQEVTSKGNTLFKQQCALENGAQFPLPFYVVVPKDKPYAPGLYDFHPASFRANRFGGIELDPYNLHLVQVTEAKPAARA